MMHWCRGLLWPRSKERTMYLARALSRLLAAIALTIFPAEYVRAQSAPGAPPAVGIVAAARRQITESSEFLGRIEAVNRVNIVARVSAFMEARLFTEGAKNKKNKQQKRLERG